MSSPPVGNVTREQLSKRCVSALSRVLGCVRLPWRDSLAPSFLLLPSRFSLQMSLQRKTLPSPSLSSQRPVVAGGSARGPGLP